jgi:hypothetical protein
MKIPNKIKIAGIEYKIIKDSKMALDEGLAGSHTTHLCQIRVQKNGYNSQKTEQTFFHEVIHAISDHYINSELSERQVDNMATGLYAFLKDNKLIK